MPSLRRESRAHRTERALLILDRLCARFPDAHIELEVARRDPWQLLVAVVLSAQCTDAKVNAVTPALFARFADVQAFAGAQARHIVPLIRTLGLATNKARFLAAAARAVVDEHGGEVPSDRARLESLPGVGRKSASVILANAFGVPALAVDTHVGRVSRRLGLTTATNPDKVEAELEALWPEARWLQAHHTLIWQGRRICKARKPLCEDCPVEKLCAKVEVSGH